MPGRLFLTTPMSTIAAFVGVTEDIPTATPRHNIQPGQEAICLTAQGFQTKRWGIIPVGRKNARGRPVMETIINARSETVFDKSAFDGVGRAVVVVDGWYEWTGQKRKKTAWCISASHPLIFAAITDVWTAPGGLTVPQVATVTCEPNADVAPIHHRMGVLLRPNQIETWLHGDIDAASALMQPWPNGQLTIEKAENVDWAGA